MSYQPITQKLGYYLLSAYVNTAMSHAVEQGFNLDFVRSVGPEIWYDLAAKPGE